MNTVNLIGNLTYDIEIKQAGGTSVTNFTVAVRNPYKPDNADFIRCVAFGKTAELLNSYVKKGQKIALEGRIQTSKFEDKEGNPRTSTEVLVGQFHFLEPKRNENEPQEDTPQPESESLPF
jgi:single-strand DNA-binding protein